MRRRGPDDEGMWRNDRCGMGFRRLSILDLSASAHQPMVTVDGRYVLVFNGEVYNFGELREQLQQRDVRFRSSGDTEVVLHSLAVWGRDALSRFNGMFALAFYDKQEQRLLLARDHAGIKPLYYLQTQNGLVFASQYDQILRHPFSRDLPVSRDVLGLYLRFGFLHAPHALLDGTFQVEPGQWILAQPSGQVEQGRFYQFPRAPHPAPFRNGEGPVALQAALDGAVKRHLVSDVPVGVFLSGGIDSPLVAANAQRHAQHPLKAFTIGIPDGRDDESASAQRFARELGLDHVVDWFSPGRVLGLLDDVIDACTEPTADYSIFPTMLVSRLARRHVKVVLSGDGGDELFWGYPSRFGTAIRQARYYRYSRPARLGWIAARRYLGLGHATREVLWPSLGRLYQKKQTIFAEEDLDALFPDLPAVSEDMTLFCFRGTDSAETASWVRWNEYYLHLARILMKVDRAGMHHSLEVRVPLLDKDVIEVATRMNWQDCLDLDKRIGKLPLRRELRRHVGFQEEAKKGFTVPMHEWLAGPLQSLLQEHVLNRSDVLGEPINRLQLKKMNRELLAGNRYKAWGLWLLLSLALWEEHHLKPSREAVVH